MSFEPIPQRTEEVAREVIDAAFTVHRELGPGLLESVYEACLCHELTCRGIPFRSQLSLPVMYRGIQVDAGLRLDVLVSECVITTVRL